MGISLLFRAEFNGALCHLRRSLDVYDQARHRPPKLTPHDVPVTCESFVTWTHLLLGQPMSHARNGRIHRGDHQQDAVGLAAKRATGAEIKMPYYFALLAEAHRRANRIVDGMPAK
jgi:hypothetical protein